MAALGEAAEIGRIRRSKIRNFCSLKDLSVRAVVWNWYFFLNRTKEHFTCLPASVLTQLVEELRGKDPLSRLFFGSIHSLNRLIGCNLERIYLDLGCKLREVKGSGWTRKDVESTLALLQAQAQGSLRLLQVTGECPPSLLNIGLSGLPNLTEVIISPVGPFYGQLFGDSTVEIIGRTLPHLRRLEINEKASEVTERGVRFLCVDDGTHGKCTLLRVLKLSEFEDNLTAEGLVVAIENLPQLRVLHHKNVIHAVVLYAKTHPGAPPLDLAGEIILNYRVSAPDWTLVCAMMPNVDDLKLSSDMSLKISEINKLSHIKCLEMKRNFTKAFNFPTDFTFHSNITELRLILEYSSFDISLITKFCRNLTVLVLKAEPSETNAYSLHGKFEVLELLTIEGDFPFIPVQNMLSSTRLMKATVAKVSGLTDSILNTICTKAEEDGETLSRLTELHLCKVNALTVESIKHLVCMCPRLAKLKVDNSAQVTSQAAHLKEFLYTHKLHDNLFVKIT